MTLLQQRVQRGVKFLQDKGYDLCSINKETLDLKNGERCILGQLEGRFSSGRDKLGLSDTRTQTLGFDYDAVRSISYDDLTTEWRRVLEELCPSPAPTVEEKS
jgi:hypothetical protein